MSEARTDQCEEFRVDIAAHALGEGALSPEARAHIAGCADCQRELRQDRRVGQALLMSAPEVGPVPELRARLLAAAEAKLKPAAPQPRPALKPHRRATPRWAAWGAVAAAFLLMLIWNVSLQGQLSQQRAEVGISRANWRTMTSLLNAETLAWYPLSGDQARGHFWTSPSEEAACLVVEGLPTPPEGMVYQIWLERGQEATNGGVLSVNDGSGWKLVRDDQPATYTAVRVTLEPAGGSAAPSGKSVLTGTLTQASTPSPTERERAAAILSADS